MDFSLQAPAARQSAYGFGERQQYQISVTSDDYRLRLGDQLYGLTDLGMTVVITRAASAPHLAPGSDPMLPAAGSLMAMAPTISPDASAGR